MFKGFSTAPPIQISSFPPGEWQVAWFGEINFHRRHVTYSQPTIEVVLLDRVAPGATVKLCIPIAQLWTLVIGSVWVDGVLVGRDDAHEERELQFPVLKAQHCAAGVPLDEGLPQFLLPFGVHPHHRGDTMSPCVRVQVGDEHVIFPSVELIRFYFGSSGALLKSLMSPSFAPERLCAEHSIDDSGNASVSLASGVPAASAEDIARMLFSLKARQSAALVSRSLLAAAASPGAKVYPRFEFPFDGVAHLRVRGVTLNCEDQIPRFLVREVVTCGARLPWRRLSVSADRSTRQRASSSGTRNLSGTEAPAGERPRSRAASSKLLPNEPKSSSALRFLPMRAPIRFADLLHKPTQRVVGPTPSAISVQALPAAAFESTGLGQGTSKGGRVDLHIRAPDHDDRSRLDTFQCKEPMWAAYFELLAELGKQPWVEAIRFVPIDNRNPGVICGELPALVDADGVVPEETLPHPQTSQRPLVSCANIITTGTASTMISLCPRLPAPRHRVFLWPGRQLDTPPHALRAIYDSLSMSGDCLPLTVPLGAPVEPTAPARQAALEFLRQALADPSLPAETGRSPDLRVNP